MVRVKEEVVLGSLLFLSSFFPYFYLSLPLIYALGIYLRLKYFPAFVSAILLLFSPLHSAIILIAYVLFFIDRRFSISFLLTTFFSILTENYLTLLLGFAIDRRGLIASGIFFLILAGATFNTTYGNLAFFLFVAGVISTLIENKVKIDAKTSAIVYLSSLLVYFHLPYLIPILVSFSPLTSLLFSPFQPYLAIIALKKLGDFKKIKWGGKVFNLLPSLISFLYPPLALSSISDVLRKREFVFYLIPFLISIVFFGLGDYSNFQLLDIISLVLLASRYINISKVISSIMILENFYPYIISVVLEFLAFYFFYLNIPNFILLSIVAIAISFPIIFNPYPLFLSFLSLVNPYVGLSSMRWFSSIFLIIPLIAYLYFKFPIYPYVFYVVGVCLSIVGIRKLVNLKLSFILNSLIYFSYSIYLFVIGEVIQVTLFTSISLAIAVLYLLLKLDKIKIDIYELLSYILVSFPVPFISLPFIVARRKLSDSDSNLLMLIEAIVVILLVKYITLLPSLTLPIHV